MTSENEKELTLRELITERIMFACTEQELIEEFRITPGEVLVLSDLDLLDLYENVCLTFY